MKINLSKKVCVVFLHLSVVFGAYAQERIVIDELKDQSILTSKGGNKITSTMLEKGVELHINGMNDSLKEIGIKNKTKQFLPRKDGKKNSSGTVLTLGKGDIIDGFITVQLTNSANKKCVIAITVEDNTSPNTVLPYDNLNAKNLIPTASNTTSPVKAKSNNFLEDIDFYDENTVVYVYDFAPKVRRFFKVYRTKDSGNDVLKTVLLNWNTEVLKAKQMAWFKVVNVNKFIYSLSLNDTIVDLGSEPNALFSQIFTGDSTLMGDLLGLISENTITRQSNATEQKTATDYNAVTELIREYISAYNGMEAKMLQSLNPCSSFLECDDITPADYHLMANKLLNIRIALAVLQNKINEQKVLLKTKSETLTTCNKLIKDIAINEKDTKAITDKGEAATAEEKKKLVELGEQNKTLKKTQTEKCTDFNAKTLEVEIEGINTELKTYAAMDNLQAKLPSEKDLKKLVVFLNNMVASNTEETFPLNTSGNMLDLTINITSRDSIIKYTGITPYLVEPIHREIPIVGRSFVSFSSGSFVTFGSRLKNKTYEWQRIPDASGNITATSKYILSESGYSAPVAGFAALGNIELKTSRSRGFGLSIGAGLTIEEKPRPSYLLGASFFMGEIRQFAFTAGINAIQVNKINNNLLAVNQQGIIYDDMQPIDYYKELKTGFFFSLTFTPFTRKKTR